MTKGDPLFLAMCKQFGLPEPIPEYHFHAQRRWAFDYAWPKFGYKGMVDEGGVALEVEGGIWTRGRHTRGKGFENDICKYNNACLLNWRVVRCTPDTLRTMATIEMLRRLCELSGIHR